MKFFTQIIVVVVLIGGCKKSNDTRPKRDIEAPTRGYDAMPRDARATEQPEENQFSCKNQPFATHIDLAEASGATVLESGVLVVGDSGTHGAYVIIDPSSGKEISRGNLPLDTGASDDLEGVSQMDGILYGLVSSGRIRQWAQHDDTFTLVKESYPIAPYDNRELVCRSPHNSNCAQNYEGLCLLDSSPKDGSCVGFAASKKSGRLICLLLDQGRLVLDPARSLQVATSGTLSGCDFDEFNRLWFGTNFFAANVVGYVENWKTPETANITRLGPLGLGFDEAIALGLGGAVYRFSDTTGSPSLLDKYICR